MEVTIEYQGKEVWVEYYYSPAEPEIGLRESIVVEDSEDDIFNKLELDDMMEFVTLVDEAHQANRDSAKEDWELFDAGLD